MVREYVGRGSKAELAAALDEARREEREMLWAQMRTIRTQLQVVEEPIALLTREIDMVLHAYMYSQGCYRQDRGSWRKRREPSA